MRILSLLVCVGEEFYKLHELISEYEYLGVSKRISSKSIPVAVNNATFQQGTSKIFVAYQKAILKVTAQNKNLLDLAYILLEEGVLAQEEWFTLCDMQTPYWTGEELKPFDPVPICMLNISSGFSKLDDKRQAELIEEFKVEFCIGIIGYSPFNGFEYVTKPGETDLPDELSHLQGFVEPVKMSYVDETGKRLNKTQLEEFEQH